MDNFFIYGSRVDRGKNPFFVKAVNKGLKLIKNRYRLEYYPDASSDMTSLEQRINYFHLADGIINSKINGDFVELGSFTGQCATLFQKLIEMHNSDKTLHLFDNFETKFNVKGSVQDALIENFKTAGLRLPVIHKGFFENTIPDQLPETIAFAHIDCGYGGDPVAHKKVMIHCLESIYPRMSKNGICVLMDYQDRSLDTAGFNANPGVKMACDEFFVSKPEKIISLFGKKAYHGYFRKVG